MTETALPTRPTGCLPGTAALPDHHEGLHSSIDSLRAQSEAQAVLIAELRTTLAEHQADMGWVANKILAEAREREWCSEYDDWAESVSAACKHFRLPERVRETSRAIQIVVRYSTEPSRHEEAAQVITGVIHDHLGDHAQLEWLDEFEIVRTTIQPN